MTEATKTVTAKTAWDSYQLLRGFGHRFYGAPKSGVWGKKDQQLKDILDGSTNPQTARLLNSIAEHTPLDLQTTENGGTFGCCRIAGGSKRKLFLALAAAPELAATKYRAAFALAAGSANPIDSPGLREAWWVCSRQPWFLRIYFQRWTTSILDDAWGAFKALGWTTEIGLALCIRARNSAKLDEVKAAARARSGSEAQKIRAGADAYAAFSDTYARRVVELYRDHGTENITQKPDPVRELALDSKPRRQDGSSVPPFPPDSGPSSWLSLVALALALALALVVYGVTKLRLF